MVYVLAAPARSGWCSPRPEPAEPPAPSKRPTATPRPAPVPTARDPRPPSPSARPAPDRPRAVEAPPRRRSPRANLLVVLVLAALISSAASFAFAS